MSNTETDTRSGEVGRLKVDVQDEIIAAVNEILPEGYEAEELLRQADVWLSVEYWHANKLRVSVDFDKLREHTDYDK